MSDKRAPRALHEASHDMRKALEQLVIAAKEEYAAEKGYLNPLVPDARANAVKEAMQEATDAALVLAGTVCRMGPAKEESHDE